MRRIEEAAIRDAQHLEPVPESAALTILPEARYGYLTLERRPDYQVGGCARRRGREA